MKEKMIAVVGATGAQGGGLARAILADPEGGFAVRAITRDPGSERALALARLGAEIVTADLDDESALADAFAGAHGAFLVTAFMEHFSAAVEKAHASNMARAAKATGLNHVIWSTLEDTRDFIALDDPRMPTLQGEYKVPHFDAKGESDRAFAELAVPTTLLYTSFYWDNLIHYGLGPKPGPDGVLVFALPMGTHKMPGIAAEDIGRCAYGILRAGRDYHGRPVGIAGEHLTGAQMAASLAVALGREVRYQAVPIEALRNSGAPGAAELANMYQFKQEFEQAYCARRSTEASRKLNPDLLTFDGWLAQHHDRIPLE